MGSSDVVTPLIIAWMNAAEQQNIDPDRHGNALGTILGTRNAPKPSAECPNPFPKKAENPTKHPEASKSAPRQTGNNGVMQIRNADTDKATRDPHHHGQVARSCQHKRSQAGCTISDVSDGAAAYSDGEQSDDSNSETSNRNGQCSVCKAHAIWSLNDPHHQVFMMDNAQGRTDLTEAAKANIRQHGASYRGKNIFGGRRSRVAEKADQGKPMKYCIQTLYPQEMQPQEFFRTDPGALLLESTENDWISHEQELAITAFMGKEAQQWIRQIHFRKAIDQSPRSQGQERI